MTEAKKPDSSGFKSVFEENKHQDSGHRMQFSVPRKSERQAVELAYQWEALAKRAAKQGAEYPQPLGLEPLIELTSKNALKLGRWLDEAQISHPDLPEIGWQDVLVELSKEHRGVQALNEAAMLEPELQPLSQRLRASGRIYRELALNALAEIEPNDKPTTLELPGQSVVARANQQIPRLEAIPNARDYWGLLRENWVVVLAVFGLVLGAVLRFGLRLPAVADIVWLATLVIGGIPIVTRTLSGMLRGNFASDVVAMLAIVVAVVMGQSFAGLVIVIMQSGGEALKRYSMRRASSSLEQLLKRAPRSAHRKSGAGLEEVSVEEVKVGEILVVRHGDLIPVDGSLLSAQAEIDESALTGEAITAPKLHGASLLSGSVNAGDPFEMQASRLSIDSKYSQIVELVQKAQQEKPPLQRLADRYAVWFTPITLVTAGLGWLFTGKADTVLAVLVVATPCPLILAVPVAVIGGINRAARFGIIVKGGAAIEQIGRAQAVVFDKTGTLTFGSPTVEDVLPNGDTTRADLLRLAGGAEQLSSHPLAQALTKAALETSGVLPIALELHEIPGGGVQAKVEGRAVVVGSPKFILEITGSPIPQASLEPDYLASYVAIDGYFAGAVRFSDQIRPGVPELIKRLRQLGVKRTVMLTGDRFEHAGGISSAAGLDSFEAGLLPEGKVESVRKLESQYSPLVMVGDGINDAPALATATVGVAMGAHGTGISAEAADIVLLVDDITRVADAVEIGQRMLRIAKQSIFVGLGLTFSLMVLAAFGQIPPVIGALAQEAIDVVVILNALRAR